MHPPRHCMRVPVFSALPLSLPGSGACCAQRPSSDSRAQRCLPSVLQQLTERACRRRRACLLGLPPPLECSELAGGGMRTRAKCPRSPAAGPAVQHQTWFNELPDEILLQASLFPGTGWQQGCCPLPGTMYRPQVLAGQLHAGARQGGARCKCGDRALLALSTKHLPALRCFGKHVLALARPWACWLGLV